MKPYEVSSEVMASHRKSAFLAALSEGYANGIAVSAAMSRIKQRAMFEKSCFMPIAARECGRSSVSVAG